MSKLKNALKRRLSLPNTDWMKFPRVIQVDTTNFCPLKTCSYCYPQWAIKHGLAKSAEMPLDWMQWILEEINRDGKTMSFIAWFLNGDIDFRLPEILDLSKSICPWLPTQVFTSGVANTQLLEDPNLDMAFFTISAHTRDLYKQVHGSNCFDKVIMNLETFLENKLKYQRVEIHCVLTRDNFTYAKDWYERFQKYTYYENVRLVLSPLVASIDNVPSREALGKLTLDDQERKVIEVVGEEGRMWTRALIPDLKPCVLWDNLSVDSSGACLQCCNWADPLKWNYGFIQDFIDEGRRLRDVWLERLANRMRNRLCRACNMKHPYWVNRLKAVKIEVKR